MIKVGLIGIGGMGGTHYTAYKSVSDCKVVAVADVREDMARERVKDDRVNVYPNMETLLANEEVDFVDICTPSYMHADMSIKALEAGIHVLSEKPMTLNSQDAERVEKAAEKSGKLYMVAHVIRFAKPYEYLKSLIESKELGKLIRLDMKRLSEKPLWSWENWMMDEKKSGGVPIDLSIHDIDFVQSILGMPDKINSVYTKMSRNGNDCIEAQLVYDDVVVTTEGAWFNYKLPFEAGFTAIFEEGMLRLQNGKLTKNGVEVELEKELVSEDTGINIKADNANVAELQYFVNCVVNNKQPKKVMPESSRKSIELVEKIISNAIVID